MIRGSIAGVRLLHRVSSLQRLGPLLVPGRHPRDLLQVRIIVVFLQMTFQSIWIKNSLDTSLWLEERNLIETQVYRKFKIFILLWCRASTISGSEKKRQYVNSTLYCS